MSNYTAVQNRCQRGEPNLASANNLLADCHSALGRLIADRDAALANVESAEASAQTLHEVISRLKAERDALQALLTAADERADVLGQALKFYADRDHYSIDDGLNWDSCSGEPANILWHEDQPWFIEDGSIARAALKPAEDRNEPNCLRCLDKKTVPSNLAEGYVMDCPDCCGEEG